MSSAVWFATLASVASTPLQTEFLGYALVFFVLAIVAGFVGLRNVAGISMGVARFFVLVFLVLAIVSLAL